MYECFNIKKEYFVYARRNLIEEKETILDNLFYIEKELRKNLLFEQEELKYFLAEKRKFEEKIQEIKETTIILNFLESIFAEKNCLREFGIFF